MKLLLVSTVFLFMLALSPPSTPVLTASAKLQVDPPQRPLKLIASNGQVIMGLEDEVRHRLLMLPYYGVFDWIECDISPNNSAVLRGAVVRPATKTDAEAELHKIESIPKIDNQIEVLPISSSDDQIRLAVYRSIFRYEGPLFQYATQAVPPIHIVVKNGHVTLEGVVNNMMDSQLAYTAANEVSGVFDVRNNLTVAK